jgi:hypothetical protein
MQLSNAGSDTNIVVVEHATTDTVCAEIQGAPLDQQSSVVSWLLDYAIDTLGAGHLDIRVLPG